MLFRHLGNGDNNGPFSWQELSDGCPTIAGFAMLAAQGMQNPNANAEGLSRFAKTILAVSATRGLMDVRGSNDSFDASDRLLGICVELEEEKRLLFRQKSDPRTTVAFLEGFRQLCQSGLVMHHLQREFSLTVAGFELADQTNAADYQEEISFAAELQH